ncbi:MAG: hypothetical protein FAZ92_00786 [Accumulibacter sp.]|nr:MAG: hypothetical protein FAZ92_00786 [Accumulibacter sp.]
MFARRQQGFEKEIAIVFAPRPVAGAVIASHEVEIGRRPAARIIAVVHAEQADATKRDGAHRHQRGEGDRAGEEALRQAAGIEAGEPVRADHRQRQIGAQRGGVARFLPALQRALELQQGKGVGIVVGSEEVGQQLAQASTPGGDRRRAAQRLPVLLQTLDQLQQRPEQRGVDTADLVVGLDPLPGAGVGADGVAEQHPAAAEQPGIRRRGLRRPRQAEARAVLGVQAPADAGTTDPAMQQRQVLVGDREAASQRRHLEQVEHVTRRQPRLRQRQQLLERLQQRVALPPRLVDDGERQVTRIIGGQQAEHRLHMRCVDADVGHHDDDVVRTQARVCVAGGEELVVHDLDLALRAVRDVETQRMILPRIDRRPAGARFVQRPQVEDVVLQLLQQAGHAAGFEELDPLPGCRQLPLARQLLPVAVVEEADEIAPLLAPGRQQRLRMHVQQFRRQLGRHSLPPSLAAAAAAQEVAVGDDVGPVMPARVVHADQDLRPPRQHGENLERLLWQAGDAKDQQAPRQSVRPPGRGPLPRPFHEGGMNRGTPGGSRHAGGCRAGGDIGQQCAPQRCLPTLPAGQRPAVAAAVGQDVAARCPGGQPVRAIHLILIEEVGQPLGQLEALALVAVVREEGVQRLVLGPAAEFRQQAQQPPEQPLFVEG